MKINIWCIESSLHSKFVMDDAAKIMIDELKKITGFEYNFVDIDDLYKGDLALIFVKSGGSENNFLKAKNKLRAPYYLLTYGHNNSLAASLEILTYIHNNNELGEVLHGSNKYIAERLITLSKGEK